MAGNRHPATNAAQRDKQGYLTREYVNAAGGNEDNDGDVNYDPGDDNDDDEGAWSGTESDEASLRRRLKRRGGDLCTTSPLYLPYHTIPGCYTPIDLMRSIPSNDG